MWKYLSRSIRETFERRINLSRKEKSSGQECPLSAFQNKFIPGISSSHKFDCGSDNQRARCKGGPCSGKKRQSRQHSESWRNNGCIQQPMLLGAIGWSGVLVLGWYLCQPIYRRRHTQSPELERLKNQTRLSRCHTKYVSLFRILSHTAFAQPLSILPQQVVRNVSSFPQPVQLQSPTTISVDVTDSSEATVSQEQYGPLTAEEALDEAADNLTKAQNSMMSGVENRLGMACMHLGKSKEALTHFQRAVELNYAPAAFNMGLCYEIGVGTAQDLKLAAKYYELASNLGHATAMYNLGVFHVRGWGGFPVDCNRARKLFNAAAELGQTNAQEALSMVPNMRDEDTTEQSQEELPSELQMVSSEPSPTSILYQMLSIIKSKQPVVEEPEPLQDITNHTPKRPDGNKPLYKVLAMIEPQLQGDKIRKTVTSENEVDFSLQNELGNHNITSNVAVECKDLSQFSIAC